MTDEAAATLTVAVLVAVVFLARAAADLAWEWCMRPPDDGDDDGEGR